MQNSGLLLDIINTNDILTLAFQENQKYNTFRYYSIDWVKKKKLAGVITNLEMV